MRTKTFVAVRESYTLLNSIAVLVDPEISLRNIAYNFKKIVLLNVINSHV